MLLPSRRIPVLALISDGFLLREKVGDALDSWATSTVCQLPEKLFFLNDVPRNIHSSFPNPQWRQECTAPSLASMQTVSRRKSCFETSPFSSKKEAGRVRHLSTSRLVIGGVNPRTEGHSVRRKWNAPRKSAMETKGEQTRSSRPPPSQPRRRKKMRRTAAW